MADSLASADRAFVDEDYEQAVKLYTEALKATPDSARVLESRAAAHIKLENFLEAVNDASRAIELESTNHKAYLRKGVACFNLEEYEAAKEAFEAGQALAPDNTQFKTWIRKCQAELEEEQQVASTVAPPPPSAQAAAGPSSTTAAAAAAAAPKAQPAAAASTNGGAASATASQPLAPSAPLQVQGKYRHQWYQLPDTVTVDVYARDLKPEQVSCSFEEQQLTVVVRAGGGEGDEEYRLAVELYGKVIPDKCRFQILTPKVEITMAKADKTQWGTLEKSTKVAAPSYSTPGAVAPHKAPSSAKNPKDWDKVASEVKELEAKGELDDGDQLSNFFKKIFSQGDEDQRRAMMKSFQESNGTVLSTNWDEVGKKKVECTPPDGMEVRKWDT